ncbi:M48 family metalloprotease [Streptomyces inhibens]|uniref:M48 family metalloprotease n=1 Tax=Streptomyces inhibens TaxID=2293571 RepID=UPI00402A9596
MSNPPRPQYPKAGPPPARPAPPPYPEQEAAPPPPPEYPAPTDPKEPPSYPTAPAAERPPPQDAYGPSDAPPEARRHPHEMAFAPRRIHLKDQQRGADATAFGTLLLHLPAFLCSLAVVAGVSYLLLPEVGWVPAVLWIASGALAFHRPTEGFFARHVLGFRYPTLHERDRLAPAWQEVTARAGVDGRAYELWIEESEELNAYATAGHIVGVTRFSLDHLPSGQLAAVLAHELGHHTGGHAWSSLLGYWYALPGRLAWAALCVVTRLVILVTSRISPAVTSLLCLVAFPLLLFLTLSVWYLVLPLLIAPYLLAAVGRRAELRADRHAAALGFAPMLSEVLSTMHTSERAVEAAALQAGEQGHHPGFVAGLLSTHPAYHTRLHHLEPYLRLQG